MTDAAATAVKAPLTAHRGFMRLGCARLASVAVGWQRHDLTGSARDRGRVGLFQFLPALVLALPAGQRIDRTSAVAQAPPHKRRRMKRRAGLTCWRRCASPPRTRSCWAP